MSFASKCSGLLKHSRNPKRVNPKRVNPNFGFTLFGLTLLPFKGTSKKDAGTGAGAGRGGPAAAWYFVYLGISLYISGGLGSNFDEATNEKQVKSYRIQLCKCDLDARVSRGGDRKMNDWNSGLTL